VALEIAHFALETAEKGLYVYVTFNEQWVEEVSRYHHLITEERVVEAYDLICQSEHLSFQQSIIEELKW